MSASLSAVLNYSYKVHCIVLSSSVLHTHKYTLIIFRLVHLLDQAQFAKVGMSQQRRHKHAMQLWQHLNNGPPEVIQRERESKHGDPSISYDTTTSTHCHSMLSASPCTTHTHKSARLCSEQSN